MVRQRNEKVKQEELESSFPFLCIQLTVSLATTIAMEENLLFKNICFYCS